MGIVQYYVLHSTVINTTFANPDRLLSFYADNFFRNSGIFFAYLLGHPGGLFAATPRRGWATYAKASS
jgi:hypothetical protein